MKYNEQVFYRFIAGLASALLAVYCFTLLFYVATSADIGLKCLLTNEDANRQGLEIRRFRVLDSETTAIELPFTFGEVPQQGDYLLEIGDQSIHSFRDFTAAMASLRTAWREEPTYASRVEDANPMAIERYSSLPPVIDYYSKQVAEAKESSKVIHGKYVRVRFYQKKTGKTVYSWVAIRSLPTINVVLLIIWCLLEFALLSVAVLSFCNRPHDQAARLFFALSFFTLPAFVGGYYWWVVSESLLLTLPFFYSAILLPVITLHFFLNYPTRHPISDRYPSVSLISLYLMPILMAGFVTVLMGIIYFSGSNPATIENIRGALSWVRQSIDAYIMVSLLYYAGSVYFLITNYRVCRQPAQRKQLQWILIASLLATPLVVYTVYLSFADRAGLSLGRGRIPMIVVSLLFLTAYAIGILRHRLMLLDQIISKHVLYVLSSQSVTVVYSLIIALGSLFTVYRGSSVPEQLLPLAFFLTIVILAMGWIRDRVQSAIDQRFFREKYRLDRAMHQMNSVIAKVADVRTLAEHMLRSCREVLQVKFSALYLRDGQTDQYELVASFGTTKLPGKIQLNEEAERLLQQAGSYQRIASSTKQNTSDLQQMQRDLNSQLMHGFEVEGHLSGVVLLGAKQSSSPFTAEDTTFVNAIGQMTGVALQCVRVQQNVSRLDAILQEKVRKIESQDRQIEILRQQATKKEAGLERVEQTNQQELFNRGDICGSSPAILQVLESAKKVASSDLSVLLRGESGTGKELLAKAVHENSSRRNAAMVSVNCAALSSSLLESELFGHVKGAFTGAHQDVVGRFQLADRGTLFLDEIGDISPDVQVKLLRVLQERQFEPVGSRKSVSVDVRLITATHQNLEKLIQEGKFREDLYYRLNVITLRLPALRDRKEDISELSLEILSEATSKMEKPIYDIDDLAFRAMLNYDWPGNIRELHNAIHRAVILAESDCVLLENLPLEVQQSGSHSISSALQSEASPISKRIQSSATKEQTNPIASQKEQIEFSSAGDEKTLLREALQVTQGNKAKAARMLGMPRSTFYSKLKKYNL